MAPTTQNTQADVNASTRDERARALGRKCWIRTKFKLLQVKNVVEHKVATRQSLRAGEELGLLVLFRQWSKLMKNDEV